ncbi:MAG: alanine--glyoxylate aminotransferase family protein [Chloroflexi bacterium]|nr:alanine--glyoxylate aminotransferase family protein [Chloroflexota bacterium]
MIPGPIEFEPAVLAAMAQPTTSHVAPDFVECFGRALDQMREVFLCPDGQPFAVAGSGTLAMDMAASNLVEPGDRVLVVNSGYFSDRFVDIFTRYGAKVKSLSAPLGEAPTAEQVRAALAKEDYRLLAVTHVDTSTGAATDVRGMAAAAREAGALSVVDGVCATAGEEMRQSDWGVDVYLTASQKAISVPPGLALLVASPRALERFRGRRTPVASYYSDWSLWLPIMEAYQERRAAYFATPPVNLVAALEVSLGQILAEGMEARFRRHRLLSEMCKAAMGALGLQLVAKPGFEAATLTAPYYPAGVDASLLGHVGKAGVILAGGLHPEIKSRYFRIGHMGPNTPGDVITTVGAIESGLAAAGYRFEPGAGVAAAQGVLLDRAA